MISPTDNFLNTSNGRGRRDGFTMIELMVVIAIIGLLMAILLPALGQVQNQMRRTASTVMIRMLDSACREYHNDFGDYPPSARPAGAEDYLPNWEGKYLLPLFLTGYAPDLGQTGVPFDAGQMHEDDGKDGFGFRVAPRGRVYGPYQGADDFDMKPRADGDPRLAFVDAFGNQVFYYRFDEGAETYHAEHNDPDPFGPYAPQEPNLPDYARRPEEQGGGFFRTNFILMTKGPNQRFEALRNNPETDDITNFRSE